MELLTAVEKPKLLVQAWGKEKTGKTHFCTTFPDPLFVFNFDLSFQHHTPRLLADNRTVFISEYAYSTLDHNYEDTTDLMHRFEEDFLFALNSGEGGTLVIDSGTQLWQLLQAFFLTPHEKGAKGILPFHYSAPNDYYSTMINMVKRSDMNLVLTMKAQEQWSANGAPTGQFSPQGQKNTPYLVNTVIRTGKKKTAEGKQQYNAFITDYHLAPNAEGQFLYDANVSYEGLLEAWEAFG